MNLAKYINQKYFLPAAIIILLILAGGGYFLYQSFQPDVSSNPQEAAKEEAKMLITEVGELIDLPLGEEPTVATITDITKLSDQPFFAKAKNGDKVLIYTQAKKAILYDPAAKKILDVAPINIGSPSAQQAGNEIKIILRNGTKQTGLTTKLESLVKTSLPNVNILAKENASKDDFEKSVVIVLNDSSKAEAEKLAKDLNAEVGNLPDGENKPENADILVILGADRIN